MVPPVARRTGTWLLTLSLAAALPPILDPHPHAAAGTAIAAAQPTPRVVLSLADGLKSVKADERASAARELGVRGTDAVSAIPSLVVLLGDETLVSSLPCGDDGDGWRRCGESSEIFDCATSPAREASRALARIGLAAMKPLVDALTDVSATVRRYAAIAIGLADDKAVVRPALVSLQTTLRDTDWQVRRSAVWALGEVRDASLLTPIAARLKDDNASVRRMAAHGLGEMEDRRAVSALVDALGDPEWSVRREVVHALGELHASEAVDALVKRLDDEHPEVRYVAVWALGEIKDQRADAGPAPLARRPRGQRAAAGGVGPWRNARRVERGRAAEHAGPRRGPHGPAHGGVGARRAARGAIGARARGRLEGQRPRRARHDGVGARRARERRRPRSADGARCTTPNGESARKRRGRLARSPITAARMR